MTLPDVDDLHDAALAARLGHLIDHKTKPLGALGRQEALKEAPGCSTCTPSACASSPEQATTTV